MARRSKLSKADAASEIGDEQMTDGKVESLKQGPTSELDDDSAVKAEDEDEDKDKKFEKTDDDDDDDDDDDETDKSRAKKSVDVKLRRAVSNLVNLVKGSDPSMRKEALFAKSMNGGTLSESEADELDALVRGRSLEAPLRERAAPQLSKSFRKAVSDNQALTDLAKGVAGSHAALCDEVDSLKTNMDEVHCLLAKAIGAMGETLGSIHAGQGAIAEALDKSLGQPAHAPRSEGVAFSERGFNGAAGGTNVARAENALREMAKSASSRSARDHFSQALFQLQTTQRLSPPVEQMIKSHLADA